MSCIDKHELCFFFEGGLCDFFVSLLNKHKLNTQEAAVEEVLRSFPQVNLSVPQCRVKNRSIKTYLIHSK